MCSNHRSPAEVYGRFRENLHQGALLQAWTSSDTKLVFGRVTPPTRDSQIVHLNVHTPNLKQVLQGRPAKGMLVYVANLSPQFLILLYNQAQSDTNDRARELMQYMKRGVIETITGDQCHLRLRLGDSCTYDKNNPDSLTPHSKRLDRDSRRRVYDKGQVPRALPYHLIDFEPGDSVLVFLTSSVHLWMYAGMR